MFIDFHTHIFPESIAQNTIAYLSGIIRRAPSMDGTYKGLQSSMKSAGVSLSLVLPVVTAPRQFSSVIAFAHSINEKYQMDPSSGILSLAGIHPDSSDYISQLKEIKALGFPGLKVHPDYQGVLFNDIRYKRILAKASELGLFVLTHAGYDISSPHKIHCTTSMISEVLKDVSPECLVLAHMGSNGFYEDVERDLIGKNVYLDTAYTIANLAPRELLPLIRSHGTDKVLFASDAPWTNQAEDVKILKNLGLTEKELAQIAYKNAKSLLRLP